MVQMLAEGMVHLREEMWQIHDILSYILQVLFLVVLYLMD
jgi:hypothetical protein